MRALAARIFAVAALAGCSSPADPSAPASGAATHVRFALPTAGLPAFGDVPFPSDAYLEAGPRVGEVPGLDRLAGAGADALRASLSALDGFGRTTGVVLFTDGAVDGASLPARGAESLAPGGSVFFVDVDPTSPARGKRLPAVARFIADPPCIVALPRPGTVLAAGVRYALVVTTAARAASGAPLAADDGLRATIGETAGAPAIYGQAITALVATGQVANAEEIAGLAVFTTSRAAAELPKLRDRLRGDLHVAAPTLLLDPKRTGPFHVAVFGRTSKPDLDAWLGQPERDENGLDWPGADNPGGIAHDAIGVVANGAFVAPAFVDPKTKHFARDAAGEVVVHDASALVPVTLVIPKAPPASAAGYPVVIAAHGLGGSRASILAWANEFARAGFATIGIDDVSHGARANETDEQNNFPGTWKGPDGLADQQSTGAGIFADFDLMGIRDNFRQTVLDDLSLVRLVENPALDLSPLAAANGGVAPKLDGSRIVWNGCSLGGMMGTMATAVEPHLRAAALQVPGGAFVHLIATDSARVHGLIGTMAKLLYQPVGDAELDAFHPLVNVMASVVEAGDPLVFADAIAHPLTFAEGPRPAPNVLVTFALDDEIMPNIATHALMRAMGATLLEPHLGEVDDVPTTAAPFTGGAHSGTIAAAEYAPATHGLGYMRRDHRDYEPGFPFDGQDPRFPPLAHPIVIEMKVREHARQVVHFLTTALAGRAEVLSTAPPVADFDGDGVSDADEAAHGTDPHDPASR